MMASAAERTRLVKASRQRTCIACGKTILPGQRCWWANSQEAGYRCLDCGRHTDTSPAKKPNRPRQRRRRRPIPLPIPPRSQVGRIAERDSDKVHRVTLDSVSEAVKDALDDFAANDTNREKIRARQELALSGSDKWGHYYTREKFFEHLATPPADLMGAVEEMRWR